MKILFGLVGSLLIQTAVAGSIEKSFRPWQGVSDPLIMSATFQRNFSSMPLQGSSKEPKRLWSGDYWALKYGNINYRWNAQYPSGYGYHSPTKEEAMKMTQEQLAVLAPSEKFDLFNGNYDYPLRKEVLGRTSSSFPTWWGICHGWSPATMNHDEPNPVTVTNPDGIQIPFGSSDVKALLSYFYAYKYEASSTHQMGYRCNDKSDYCKHDLNAGAFHIVLTNRVGIDGGTFIADMERKKEVWNHPVSSYRTVITEDNKEPSRDSAWGTWKRVRVQTNVNFVLGLERNTWNPVLGTNMQKLTTRHYEYDLDLARDGTIIGGDWKSKDRPDFLWFVERAPQFDGMFARLGELL